MPVASCRWWRRAVRAVVCAGYGVCAAPGGARGPCGGYGNPVDAADEFAAVQGTAGETAGMEIAQWWPAVTAETRDWLVEHNGEPLPTTVRDDVLRVNGDLTDPSWWAGESVDGSSELTDAATDWIESAANDE
ncbi:MULTISPECIES: hypothetical protein [Nocardiaceae]|uniref:Uncharacterized protein n=1 Tax=Rhodococcoides corynebacterioides TaxID=53972 RepID=A0ABS2KNS1_9NOCA|nr:MULTISPECIES: hypothetical protein [Rhodococcus]MBM7413533.1 hypothetical protein [Rhodococcus corynebacterioides]MBP1115996.1 hypothetical protein [Rhodococcus sp. PvP016]